MQTSRKLFVLSFGFACALASMSLHCASTECDQFSDCNQGFTCAAGKCVLPPAPDAGSDAAPDVANDHTPDTLTEAAHDGSSEASGDGAVDDAPADALHDSSSDAGDGAVDEASTDIHDASDAG